METVDRRKGGALAPLFVSHGAPVLLLTPSATRDFLAGLAGRFAGAARPPFVLVVSAHWMAPSPRVDVSDRPATIHDFAGFGPELAAWRYPAPGAPVAAEAAARALEAAGIATRRSQRGLDHGAWIPLQLAFPQADVPAFQLAIAPRRDARFHFEMGRALAPLLAHGDPAGGVAPGGLLLASGSATHDLARLGAPDDGTQAAFDQWLVERVEAGDVDALLDWERAAPHAFRAHPTPDHLLPLFVALGAAAALAVPGEPPRGRTLHRDVEWGAFHMTAFEWPK